MSAPDYTVAASDTVAASRRIGAASSTCGQRNHGDSTKQTVPRNICRALAMPAVIATVLLSLALLHPSLLAAQQPTSAEQSQCDMGINDLELILPAKVDGRIIMGEPVLISRLCAKASR